MKLHSNFVKILLGLSAIFLTKVGMPNNLPGDPVVPAQNQIATIRGVPPQVQQTTITGLPGFLPGSDDQRILRSVREPEWSNFFGGAGKDECYSAIQTSDGGYIMVGRSNSYGAGDFDAWVVKTDASGQVAWTKTYGDTYIDEAYAIKEVSGGGYIIAGMSTAFGWAGEGWLIRTNASGDIIWSRGYHPANGSSQAAWDYFYDVVENSDGSFTVVGDCCDTQMNIQGWIVKVNSDGDVLWEHEYGDIYWERFFSMQPTSDGGYVAVGDRHWSYDNDTTFKHDGWLLKINDLGDTVWTRHFGGVDHDIFRCVKQTSDGGYIICGEREVDVINGFHGWLIRTDASGQEIFNKTLAKGGLYGVQETSNGNFMAAGTTVTQQSAYDGWLLKANPDGVVLWESMLTGTELDDMYLSLNPTTDGGYIMGGKYNHDPLTGDYWLVKSAPEGLLPLSYFFENFDEVTPPALPENWSGLLDVMLSNTIAEVRSIEQGSTTSLPNAAFIMNGLNGSNGQMDSAAFVSLVTPYVVVGPTGATLTFWATGGNNIQVGTLSDPLNPATFTLIEEVPLTFNFEEHTVTFTQPGNTWIALKHANTMGVTPLFVDDLEYKQIVGTGIPGTDQPDIRLFPNPVNDRISIEYAGNIVSVRIFNSLGSQVWTTSDVKSRTLTINTSSFAIGNYLLQLISDDGTTMTKKFVIYR